MTTISACAEELNILSKRYPLEKIQALVDQIDSFTLFPAASERERWEALPETTKATLIARGEAALGYRYTGLPASVLLDDTRQADYNPSAHIQNQARRKLVDLVLAEATENQSRFMSAIVDLIWAISEESSWPTLSHYYLHKEGNKAKLELALPDVSDPVVDLWAAEVAKNFAWTYHLLADKFDAITPRINQRIKHEVKRRVLDPARLRDDFWWMGFSGGNGGIINNWNPWISSNWLPAVLLLEDRELKAQSIHKILRVVDQFINSYALDGGVDEGPAYWDRAGGSLFDVLTTLHAWSDGEINIFDHPKIQNIFRYIYRAHIHDSYAVNFTDAPARLTPSVFTLYHMGTILGDERLKAFAATFADNNTADGLSRREIQYQTQGGRDLDRIMYPLFYLDDEFANQQPGAPYQRDVWFERVEHMFARSREGTHKGFFLAAKGGHNIESHNHNDVGNFIIYHDGEPVIIDVGPETYTLKTFGDDRYTLWNMRSDYHTLPTINGQLQAFGAEYRASDVNYEMNDNEAALSMDIANAYPAAAHINSWRRRVALKRDTGVTLEETINLAQINGKTTLHFITPHQVKVGENELILSKPGRQSIRMGLPESTFDVAIETIEIEDPVMMHSWQQDQLYRIVLTPVQQEKRQPLAYPLYRISFVIPAKAGIHKFMKNIDSRFHGSDENKIFRECN